jgi:hypothetical protein
VIVIEDVVIPHPPLMCVLHQCCCFCFLQWDSYDVSGPHRNLIELQECFYQAQRILHSTGAFLRQFLVDDKGCVLIACWGVPHLSYLDNAQRALSSAAQIRCELEKRQMHCSFGITTGDVYCGTVGSPSRMEYAAIGSVVNLSARLMAKANKGIYIDAATFVRLSPGVGEMLQALEPIKVKGKDEPIAVFSYVGTGTADCSNVLHHTKELDVQDHEIAAACRTALFATLDSMHKKTCAEPSSSSPSSANWLKVKKWLDTKMQVVLISGKEGSGRTTVVVWLKKQALSQQIAAYGVKLGRKDTSVPYGAWKKMFVQLMPKDLFLNNETQRVYVRALLKEVYPGAPQLAETVGFPVLKSAFGITCDYHNGITYTNSSSSTASEALLRSGGSMKRKGSKSAGLSEPMAVTLFKIFAHLLSSQAALVIFENIETADEASLRLLTELTKVSSCSVIVLTALCVDQSVTGMGAPDLGQGQGQGQSLVEASAASTKSLQTSAFNSSSWAKLYKDKITQRKQTTEITLENYTIEDINDMLCVALGTTSVPLEISQIVQDFSGGSYFWVREILQFLKLHGSEEFLSAIGETDANKEGGTQLALPQISSTRTSYLLAESASGEDLALGTLSLGSRSSSIHRPGPGEASLLAGMYKPKAPTGGSMDMSSSGRSGAGAVPASPMGSPPIAGLASPRHQSLTSARGSIRSVSRTTGMIKAVSHRNLNQMSRFQAKLDKLVLCRFENLHPDAQRVLRSASIVGMTFPSIVLFGILPRHLKNQMANHIKTLLNLKWLYQDTDNESLYQFAHPHAHQIIYELTPSSERNQLHRAIGDYMEETYGEDSAHFAQLSYHYKYCDPIKSIQYAVKAVPVLLAVHSVYEFSDCVSFLSNSMSTCRTPGCVRQMLQLVRDAQLAIERFEIATSEGGSYKSRKDFQVIVETLQIIGSYPFRLLSKGLLLSSCFSSAATSSAVVVVAHDDDDGGDGVDTAAGAAAAASDKSAKVGGSRSHSPNSSSTNSSSAKREQPASAADIAAESTVVAVLRDNVKGGGGSGTCAGTAGLGRYASDVGCESDTVKLQYASADADLAENYGRNAKLMFLAQLERLADALILKSGDLDS